MLAAGYGFTDPSVTLGAAMTQILAAYCINVSDIERSIEFWDGVMGIPLQSRTEIEIAHEAVLQAPQGGSRLQLAQPFDQEGPIDMIGGWAKLPAVFTPGPRLGD